MARSLPTAKVKQIRPSPGDPRTQRKCGRCTACCYALGVDEISKPRNQICWHARQSGCSIYADRPVACATYNCLWLDGWFETRHKPNRFGIILDYPPEMADNPIWAGIPFVVARVVIPGADTKREAKLVLGALADERAVVLLKGSTRKFLGPEPLVQQVVERAQVRASECR